MWFHSLSLLPWMFLYCIYFFVSTIECCGANMCMYCVRYPSLALGTYCSHGIWRKLMQFVLLLHSKTNISLSWSNPSPFFSVFFNSFILNSSLLHLFFFSPKITGTAIKYHESWELLVNHNEFLLIIVGKNIWKLLHWCLQTSMYWYSVFSAAWE